MSKNQVSIIIRARDLATKVFRSVGDAAKRMGSVVASAAKFAIGGAIAFTGAVAAMAVKAVQAFSVQEQAVKGLEGALMGLGASASEIDRISASYQRLSSEIQDETGVSDEATLAMITQLTQLGILESQMDQAARAVIGLKSVGVEQVAASKAIAMALQGQFTMLQRYVPALRAAKTETEKAALVNNLLTAGYAQQRKELSSVAGGWAALKGRIGDVMESVGGAIVKGLNLGTVLANLGDKIKSLGAGDAFGGFLSRVEAVGMKIREIVSVLSQGGEGALKTLGAIGGLIKAAFMDGAAIVGNGILKAAPVIGRTIGNAIMSVVEPFGDERKAKDIAKGLGISVEEARQVMARQKAEDEGTPFNAGLQDASNTERALARLDAVLSKYGEKIDKKAEAVAGAGDAGGGLGVASDEQKKVFDLVKAAEVRSNDELEKEIDLLEKRKGALGEAVQAEERAIDALDDFIEKQKEFAAKTLVADILKDDKEKADFEKKQEADRKRAQKIAEKQARGVRVNKADAEFLRAFGKIQEAWKLAEQGAGDLANRGAALDWAKDAAAEETKKIGVKITQLNSLLQKNLTAPEG